jgi:cation diffusion facilitator CzcD-associated flavoprotein CzcO
LKKWGLGKHSHGGITRLLGTGTAPAIDNGFVAALKAGKVTIVPEIECFESTGVRLIDNQYIEPDIVIAATGYQTGLQSILGYGSILDESGVPKIDGAKQMHGYPGLWFTGMKPRLTGFFHQAGHNAREIAAAIDIELHLEDAGISNDSVEIQAQAPSANADQPHYQRSSLSESP